MASHFSVGEYQRPIGLLDSGIGGLTVAKALSDRLPHEHLVFFGDTTHLPYGDKSAASIRRFTARVAQYLITEWDCKAIVIACNTASAVAGSYLRKRFQKTDVQWYDVIQPAVQFIAGRPETKKVGIIGTRRTIASRAYPRRLRALRPDMQVRSLTTSLLAPMIEEGFFNNRISQTIIEWYLKKPPLRDIQLLLLGCTHYPLIQQEIERFLQQKVIVLDSAQAVAVHIARDLAQKRLLNPEAATRINRFLVSDFTQSFQRTAQMFFGQQVYLDEVRLPSVD